MMVSKPHKPADREYAQIELGNVTKHLLPYCNGKLLKTEPQGMFSLLWIKYIYVKHNLLFIIFTVIGIMQLESESIPTYHF